MAPPVLITHLQLKTAHIYDNVRAACVVHVYFTRSCAALLPSLYIPYTWDHRRRLTFIWHWAQIAYIPSHGSSQRLFYWAPLGVERHVAYEAAALQALRAVQTIYGFVVVDYSLHGLLLYRTLAQRLLPVANRGIQLARLLIMASHDDSQANPQLLAYAHQLMHNVNNMSSGPWAVN